MEHQIISRTEWGARYRGGWPDYASTPTRPHRPLPATEAWLHYPGAKTPPGPDATLAEDIAYIRYLEDIGYQRFGPHTGTGWGTDTGGDYGAGISYSLLFAKSGRIFRGHDPARVSSHTAGHNTPGMGYCILISAGETANDAQIAAAAWALNEQVRSGELTTARLNGGHRDVVATACPTDALYAQISTINAAAGGTVARRRPTRTDFRRKAAELKPRGFKFTCGPDDYDKGYCGPNSGNRHGHASDSRHLHGLAFDVVYGPAGVNLTKTAHLQLLVDELDADPNINWRLRWRDPGTVGTVTTLHRDHAHGDDRDDWWESKGDAHSRAAIDKVTISYVAFPNFVPRTNSGFTLSRIRRVQGKAANHPTMPFLGRLDGYLGDISRAWFRDFQTSAGLKPDGLPGPLTEAALDAALVVLRPLQYVREFQTVAAQIIYDGRPLYGDKIDGLNGANSTEAAKTVQRRYGLDVDGDPGPLTLAAAKKWLTEQQAPKPDPAPVVPPAPTLAQRIAPHRVGGADRWEVAVNAAGFVLPESGEGIILAADGTPDLMAAFQLAQTGVAVALPVKVGAVGLPSAIRGFIATTRPDWIVILGGAKSVTDTAAYQAFQAANITI